MLILGLDVSSTRTGASLVNEEGDLIRFECWDTSNKNKFPSLMWKCRYFEEQIARLMEEFPLISDIFIEESLQTFQSGQSSAQTLSTLSKVNGIVSFICFQNGIEAEYIGASTARKLYGIKIPKRPKTLTKTEKAKWTKKHVLERVLDKEKDFTVEYTPKGNPAPKYFDMADSVVVARAGYILCTERKKKS